MRVKGKSGDQTAVDGRGGERGKAHERLGRQEPQQKVQESPRRLTKEGLEKTARRLGRAERQAQGVNHLNKQKLRRDHINKGQTRTCQRMNSEKPESATRESRNQSSHLNRNRLK